jgi:ribonuclease-3
MSQKWNDPKSQLQQCCLTLRNPDGGEPDIPTYKVISVEGPTNTRLYKVAVYFKGQRLAAGKQFLIIELFSSDCTSLSFLGSGHSIQEAEMKAAEEALQRRADLFPHLEKQRNFIENRFRKEFGHSSGRSALKRRHSDEESEESDEEYGRTKRYRHE